MRTVRVSVPATTANLGPGFDSLALALDMHTTVQLRETDQGLTVAINGEGHDVLPRDASNLAFKGAQAVFRKAGRTPSGLHIIVSSEIPVASGLGSSAAAVLGGIVAANAIVNNPLDREELLRMAVELEGHPDNVTAAMLGSLAISSHGDDGLVYKSIAVQPTRVIVVLPEADVSTSEARAALPKEVALKDAAQNVGRAALVVQALVHGDFDLLGKAMQDRLHEPFRRKFIPGYEDALQAARKAGASAIAISGAGPAVVAFADEGHARIAQAIADAFRKATKKAARTWILAVETQGVSITEMATDMPVSRPRVTGVASPAQPTKPLVPEEPAPEKLDTAPVKSMPASVDAKADKSPAPQSPPPAKSAPRPTTPPSGSARPLATRPRTAPLKKPAPPQDSAVSPQASKPDTDKPETDISAKTASGRSLGLGEAADLIRGKSGGNSDDGDENKTPPNSESASSDDAA